jgi:hypothetical protein
MDDFEYEPFVTMCVDDRLKLLRVLANIFVAQYCDNTWRIGLERGIFGPNPGAITFDGEDGKTYSLLDFICFPFLESQVLEITQQTNSTLLQNIGTKTRTGTCHCCFVFFHHFTH